MFHPVVRRLILLLAAPATLVAAAAPAHATVPAPPTVTPAVLMSQVVTMTNQQRAAHGCRRLLTVDQGLTVASVRQSVYMARTGRHDHVWSDGTTFARRSHLAGYEQPSGENIAWGYRTATEVIQAWMASPGHRANMLNCGARSIGTGVAYAANGTLYYTQVFGWE
ncbi:CAP domain-containing protein [Actinoplanes solisilvae]|uniref:CAP domain-containing protein n=1 Tax=Actinoplanes solisilvae TaxID=2486853 RepID=UPI001F0BECFD|nr:CAP domain-containing protein [Actinoplanes solisilvae]